MHRTKINKEEESIILQNKSQNAKKYLKKML